MLWGAVGLVLARSLPGLSYLFVVPTLLAGLFGGGSVAAPANPRWEFLSVLVPSWASAVLFLPLLWFFYGTLGIPAMAAVATLLAFSLFTAAPFGAALKPIAWIVPTALLVLGTLVAFLEPIASTERPERMNYVFLEDGDKGAAEWLVSPETGRLPEAVIRAAAFGGKPSRVLPWQGPRFTAPAEGPTLPPPALRVQEEDASGASRLIRGLLVSSRGAPAVLMVFPPGSPVGEVTIGGRLVQLEGPKVRRLNEGWAIYESLTTPPEGIAVTIKAAGNRPIELTLADVSPGLPATSATLLLARPPWAVPSHGGDETLVTRHLTL